MTFFFLLFNFFQQGAPPLSRLWIRPCYSNDLKITWNQVTISLCALPSASRLAHQPKTLPIFYLLIFLFYFPKMCSLSLRINTHMKHAYKMFYNMIDYGITDW